MSHSRLLDLRVEESRVIRQAKPLRCGEASSKLRALCRDRTQAMGALAQGLVRWLPDRLAFLVDYGEKFYRSGFRKLSQNNVATEVIHL